ncbi:hypothetical protein KJ785_04835 [Patescibacteria group bacterium]|nr:hypothetical protein [Patescibacteria group bacterium]
MIEEFRGSFNKKIMSVEDKRKDVEKMERTHMLIFLDKFLNESDELVDIESKLTSRAYKKDFVEDLLDHYGKDLETDIITFSNPNIHSEKGDDAKYGIEKAFKDYFPKWEEKKSEEV